MNPVLYETLMAAAKAIFDEPQPESKLERPAELISLPSAG